MELLIGTIHCEEFLEDVVEVINHKYPKGIESLMLEMPSNWEDVKGYCLAGEQFFFKLAEIYRSQGAKIIFGDKPMEVLQNKSWL